MIYYCLQIKYSLIITLNIKCQHKSKTAIIHACQEFWISNRPALASKVTTFIILPYLLLHWQIFSPSHFENMILSFYHKLP
jgi:hypothetical protein